MTQISTEIPEQHDSIRRLLIDAFGGEDEATLVADLRRDGDVGVALSAVDDSGVIGHVVFSELVAELDGAFVKGVALAPLAVRADRRNLGVGGQLVRAGVVRCRSLGYGIAVVVGEPAYYGRFGFSVSAGAGFACAFAGPYLQVLELTPGALGSGQGTLNYARAFGRIS